MNELDQEVVSAYVLSQTVSKCANSIENILVQARKSFSGKLNFLKFNSGYFCKNNTI